MSGAAYYFGCWDQVGHGLRDSKGGRVRTLPDNFPVPERTLDGGFLPPRQPQYAGRAVLAHLGGWTILSF